jgi:hypothetical protein
MTPNRAAQQVTVLAAEPAPSRLRRLDFIYRRNSRLAEGTGGLLVTVALAIAAGTPWGLLLSITSVMVIAVAGHRWFSMREARSMAIELAPEGAQHVVSIAFDPEFGEVVGPSMARMTQTFSRPFLHLYRVDDGAALRVSRRSFALPAGDIRGSVTFRPEVTAGGRCVGGVISIGSQPEVRSYSVVSTIRG